jgi:predicted transcriptional regulator
MLLRLPRELKDGLVIIARQNDRSTAAEVRRALGEHVERAQRAGTSTRNVALRREAVEAGSAARDTETP